MLDKIQKCSQAFVRPFELPFILSSASNKGMYLFVALEINLLSAATFPFRLCISHRMAGILMSLRVLTCLGLASILLACTIKPKNFPDETPNEHFRGFGFIPYLQST